MGIRHFFYWFKTNFDKNIKNVCKGQPISSVGVSVDNLMIDCNGLFHASTQLIYEYGKHERPKRLLDGGNTKRRKMGGLAQQKKVFEDVCLNIEQLVARVEPKKRLILCVDGPAPISKQNQQRQRRFRSASEKEEDEFDRFDSNALTPGTQFMDYLSKYIDWYIKKSMSENPMWSKFEVVFSNERAEGEGEHKIINYIRRYGNLSDSFCIHGSDADLIMLSLGTHLPNFWVLREDSYDQKNDFFLIDIGGTREKLVRIMDWNDDDAKKAEKTKPFNPEYAVNDFIFICFMVGNDFLPHIPSLEIIEGGIDQMLDVYKNMGESYGHLTKLNRKNDIVFEKVSLEVFLGTIAQYDKGILENKLLKNDKFFPDPLLEKHAKFNKGRYNLDIEKYREEYYKESFDEDTDMKELCHQYFVGLQWVLSYYTRGVPDWKWCFKHHYAPFAHELADHLEDFKRPKWGKTVPTLPFQQLLSVLPPKSHALIPEPLSSLLTDPSSKLKDFCPDEFEIDLRGKRQAWEGLVLLPMVDFDVIVEEYDKLAGKVSTKDMRRNVLGKSFLYTYNKNTSFEFKSFYGDIEECKVMSSVIEL